MAIPKISLCNSIDTLREVKNADIINWTFKIYDQLLDTYIDETDVLYLTLDKMEQIARQRNSCEMKAALTFLRGEDLFFRYDSGNLDCIRLLNEAARQQCSDVIATQAMFYIGKIHIYKEQYPKGFEYMLTALDHAKVIGYQRFPRIFMMYTSLGQSLFSIADYRTSIRYLKEGFRFSTDISGEKMTAYNTIGLCYRALKEYDSANAYFFKGLSIAEQTKHEAWTGVLNGNIGSVLNEQRQYQEAIPYLYRDMLYGLKTNQPSTSLLSACRITKAYMELEKRDSARYIFDYIQPHLQEALANGGRGSNKILLNWYTALFNYYKYENDEKALKYADSLFYYYISQTNIDNVNLAEDVGNKLSIEKHLSNIKVLQIKNERQYLVILFTAVLFILVTVIAWQKIIRIRIAQKHARAEIEDSKNQLDIYVRNLKDKNTLLEKATAEILRIQHEQELSQMEDKTTETLNTLRETTILTEDDWTAFKKIFGKVHGDFFIRLNNHFAELTNAEQRLLALSKLGLTVTEKANVLGISPASVRKTKLRLYKKTGLTEEEIFHEISL